MKCDDQTLLMLIKTTIRTAFSYRRKDRREKVQRKKTRIQAVFRRLAGGSVTGFYGLEQRNIESRPYFGASQEVRGRDFTA
jgi:hypothetical protein